MLVPDVLLNIMRWLKVIHLNSMHSCILVNKEWCSLAIPILWDDPFSLLRQKKCPWINRQYIHFMRTLLQGKQLDDNGPKSMFEERWIRSLYGKEAEVEMTRVHELVTYGYNHWSLPYPSYIRYFDSYVLTSCIIHWKRCFVNDIIFLADYEKYFLRVVDDIQKVFRDNNTCLLHARVKMTPNNSVKLLVKLWLELMDKKNRPIFESLKTLRIEYAPGVRDSTVDALICRLASSCNSFHRLTIFIREWGNCESLLLLIVTQRIIPSIYLICNNRDLSLLGKTFGTHFTVESTDQEILETGGNTQFCIKLMQPV